MGFVFRVLCIIAAVAFPAFLIKAIRGTEEEIVSNNTFWACVSFGFIVFVFIGLH